MKKQTWFQKATALAIIAALTITPFASAAEVVVTKNGQKKSNVTVIPGNPNAGFNDYKTDKLTPDKKAPIQSMLGQKPSALAGLSTEVNQFNNTGDLASPAKSIVGGEAPSESMLMKKSAVLPPGNQNFNKYTNAILTPTTKTEVPGVDKVMFKSDTSKLIPTKKDTNSLNTTYDARNNTLITTVNKSINVLVKESKEQEEKLAKINKDLNALKTTNKALVKRLSELMDALEKSNNELTAIKTNGYKVNANGMSFTVKDGDLINVMSGVYVDDQYWPVEAIISVVSGSKRSIFVKPSFFLVIGVPALSEKYNGEQVDLLKVSELMNQFDLKETSYPEKGVKALVMTSNGKLAK